MITGYQIIVIKLPPRLHMSRSVHLSEMLHYSRDTNILPCMYLVTLTFYQIKSAIIIHASVFKLKEHDL